MLNIWGSSFLYVQDFSFLEKVDEEFSGFGLLVHVNNHQSNQFWKYFELKKSLQLKLIYVVLIFNIIGSRIYLKLQIYHKIHLV